MLVLCTGTVVIGQAKKLVIHGVDPTFNFSSGTHIISSPLLKSSKYIAYMNFSYQLSGDDTVVDITNNIVCYSDMAGTVQVTTWLKHVDMTSQDTNGSVCPGLLDLKELQSCKTIMVKTTVQVTVGVVTIGDIHFGDVSICSAGGQGKLMSLMCGFEDSDCGIRNDACGLVDWEIRSDSNLAGSSQQTTDCQKQTGISLLKQKIQNKCSYEDLEIADLQRSGFVIVHPPSSQTDPIPPKPKKNGKTKGKRSAGYYLILDPSKVTGVAIGVLDLPEVERSDANAFLTFYHEMVEGGLHDLLVTAVCLSDPARHLVPLDAFGTHYHNSNFDGTGSEGIICLNIHKYVDEYKCSEFAIQMKAAAVETALIVDNIFFADKLSSNLCSKLLFDLHLYSFIILFL